MIPLYDKVRPRRLPVVTWLLIAANLLVFLYENSLSLHALEHFIRAWGLSSAALLGKPATGSLRILTSMFVHGGWVHVISNMWVLYIFGDNIEDRLGSSRYLVFYLLGGVAAAFLQVYNLPVSTEPMIGASGAIAGVLGAYLVLFPRARIASIVPIFFLFTVVDVPAFLFLIFWFVAQLFSGWLSIGSVVGSGVAWWAHIGGFLFGVVAVRLFAQPQNPG